MKRYFNLILLGSVALGLLLPLDLGLWLKYLIWTQLFIIILLSYFQMELDVKALGAQTGRLVLFYVARFCLLPLLLFGATMCWDAFYAQGVFLLAVLPAGVTAPALTALFKGRMELSLIVVIFSSLLCPFLMPFLSKWVLGSVLEIDTWGMLLSLAITVIGPLLIFWPLRKQEKVVAFARRINTPVVVSLMGVFVITVTAQNRDLIFAEPVLLVWHLLVASVVYALFYAVGWYGWWGGRFAERLAVSFASGANNIALGIAVGYTYFSPEIGFFFIAGQLAWTLMLAPVQRLLKSREAVQE